MFSKSKNSHKVRFFYFVKQLKMMKNGLGGFVWALI